MDKPIPEAVLEAAMRAYEAEVDGAVHSPAVPREAMRAALTAAQQQGQGGGEVIGYVRRAPFHTRDIWKDCSKSEYDFIIRNGYWTDPKDSFNWPSIARPIYDTAHPSAPVGVGIDLLRWVKAQADDEDANPRFRELYSALTALAQQPAAVDEAAMDRAELAFKTHPFTDCVAHRESLRAAVAAALATQHQGEVLSTSSPDREPTT